MSFNFLNFETFVKLFCMNLFWDGIASLKKFVSIGPFYSQYLLDLVLIA